MMERVIYHVTKKPYADTVLKNRIAVVEFHDSFGLLEMDIPELPDGTVLSFSGSGFRITGFTGGVKEENTAKIPILKDILAFYEKTKEFIPGRDFRDICKKYAGNLCLFFEQNPYFFFSGAFFKESEIAQFSFTPEDVSRYILPVTFEQRRQEIMTMIEHELILSETEGNTGTPYRILCKRVSEKLAKIRHPLNAGKSEKNRNNEQNLTAFINFSNAALDPENDSCRFYMDTAEMSGDTVVFRKKIYDLEKRIYEKVKKWVEHPNTLSVDSTPSPFLSGEQNKAIGHSFRDANMTIITGGPGTGKTAIINEIIRKTLACDPSVRICAAAPTGKATKRAKETITKNSRTFVSTTHMIVNYGKPSDQSGFMDKQYHLIIIDESSMLPLDVFDMLLNSTTPDMTKFILIGDVDQLPSVDAGNILEDLIKIGVPSFVLKENYRSGEDIVGFSRQINKGILNRHIMKDISAGIKNGKGIFFRDISGMVKEDIFQEIYHTAKEAGDASWTVLLSRKEGKYSAQSVNAYIAREERSGNKRKNVPFYYSYYADDPVIALRTNYDDSDNKQYYNGDTGKVLDAMPEGREIVYQVKLNGEDHETYIKEEDLSLAYALTIHKSQGSEYDTVILFIPENENFISRKLLYTAVTRASGKVVIFSTLPTLERAVRNTSDSDRITLLSTLPKLERTTGKETGGSL